MRRVRGQGIAYFSMPWLGDNQPSDATTQKWHIAFKNALLRRIAADQLSGPVRELKLRHSASSDSIARVLLGFRARDAGNDDPLLFSYASLLLHLKVVRADDLMMTLLNTSRFTKAEASQLPKKPSAGLPSCEERMFNLLTQMYLTKELPCGKAEFHGLVYALTRWMHGVTEHEMSKQLEGGALHSADAFSFSMYEALATLALTIFGNEAFRNVAKLPWWKGRRIAVVSEMLNFDTHVLQWMQSQMANRLPFISTMPPFLETDDDGRPVFTDAQIVQSIQDLLIVNSRAGLYIWLNACLCARPLTDDLNMLTYLQTRYSGNNQALVVDLLVASFDVLTNSLLRKESDHDLKVVRSFICNKIPTQLTILSGFMAPSMTVETCIQMGFMSITMDALPPISTGAAEVRDKLKQARLEFLQACTLHALVSENAMAAILQEPPMSPPRVAKHTKESLLAKHGNNVGLLEPLVDELDGLLGNSGAIAGYIVDIIGNLCASKDTMSLKNLCNVLLKRIPIMDILLQYAQPANLLYPLCTLLNNWTHDQDQMEFTPAYEEFASILLFILAVVRRYEFESADLGLANDGNFIAKMLQETTVSKVPSDLTEEARGQLGKWIEGLYATDEQGETTGIEAEVMRPCPPQDFYLLVPTLFEQSVLACKAGALSMKTFAGGLELLVEPFLLPSLVGGLSWLIKHSWEDHGDADSLLQILEKLLKPSSSSQEPKAMHKAILAIVAKPLHQSLQTLSQKRPEKKEVNGYMELLKPYLNRQRIMEGSKSELDEWTAPSSVGIAIHIRNAIRDQVSWVSAVGPTPPPQYTHKLFGVGCSEIGVDAVLDAMIEELREQTATGNGPLTLDVCTAMITAPLANVQASVIAAPQQPQKGSTTVRDTLRLRNAIPQKLLQKTNSEAEALVRLGRRVEAQLAVTQLPQIALPMPMQDQSTDQMMADLGFTEGDLATTGADTSLEQVAALGTTSNAGLDTVDLGSALDPTMDLTDAASQNMANLPSNVNTIPDEQAQDILNELNLDIGQPLQNADGSNMEGQPNPDDDIFAGIDLGEDFDFS